jgi:Na+/H+ antiporter NhaC
MESIGLLSLLPAGITILVAILTHRVATALFLGIVTASVLIGNIGFQASLSQLFKYLHLSFTDLERIKICAFLLFVGGMLEIISKSGGYQAFSQWVSGFLKKPRTSRIALFFLSLSIFIDDYANLLICGASMRSMAKVHKISPALLTYLVDRTATFVSVMVVSTWAAFESSLMSAAGSTIGVHKSATEFFFGSLPYHASTYFGLLLVMLTAWQGKWLGAHLDFGDDSVKAQTIEQTQNSSSGKLSYILVPMGLLISLTFGGLIFSGIYNYTVSKTPKTLIALLGEIPTVEILLIGSLISFIAALVVVLKNKALDLKSTFKFSLAGFKDMVSPCMVIILAKGLAEASTVLGVGSYISQQLSLVLSPQWIPVTIFVISLLITIATGFSWSSMAIVMPIAFKLTADNNLLQFIPVVSGAVISGAISGGLMVPYSDTTVLSSAAFGISPIYHAKTQLIQTMVSSLCAILFFALIGFSYPFWIATLASIALIVLIQALFAKESKISNQKAKV